MILHCRYRTAGRSVIDVMKTHCNKIERASVDEAYLDITQLVDERLSQYSKELDTKLNTTFVVGHTEVGNNDEGRYMIWNSFSTTFLIVYKRIILNNNFVIQNTD